MTSDPDHWSRGPMIAFDIETSDIDTETARIVTAVVIVVNDGFTRVSEWLVNPGVPIKPGATAVHGITDEMAAEGTPAAQVISEILATLRTEEDWPVVIYNAPFDLTILDREVRRHGLDQYPFVPPFVVDPLVLDKQLDRYRKGSRKLADVARHYGVRHDKAHDAAEDAITAARLAYRLGNRWPTLDLAELHEAQIHWAREQARGLRRYFYESGQGEKASSVSDEWPMIPIAPGGVLVP